MPSVIENRTIINLGGSDAILLPKWWTRWHGLVSGQRVQVTKLESGELLITPENQSAKPGKQAKNGRR